MVALPLIVAVVSGFLGYLELRDALTYDVRGLHGLTVRADALRRVLDEETAVRGYAATRRAGFIASYNDAQRQLTLALGELAVVSNDLAIPDGGRALDALASLHDRWLTTVALPITSGRLPVRQANAVLRRGTMLTAAFRDENRKLGKSIRQQIVDHQHSSSGQLFRIALLFVASIATCALGAFLGARQLMRIERERDRAESDLREQETLHTRDRSWSRLFQRAVLPPGLPLVAGCRFDAVYEPGENDSYVGGDWYDAVRLVDGRILISIGDVAGSGVEAAVVMGVARQIMRGIAQVHADPALMLDAADRALRLEHGEVFVTAWVGIIDLVTHNLTFSSAGHPPALVASPDGALRELRDAALPLGLRQGHQGRSTTIGLIDGSTLALYTDGLSEATHDILAGEALVRAALAAIAQLPWRRPATEIQRRVLADGSMDDVAILVARFDFAQAERYIRRLEFDVRAAGAAREARDTLLNLLSARKFGPAEMANAELVFGELIGNVLRHADERPTVEVAVDCGGPQTVVHVFDRGPGFRHMGRLPSDPYSESGRGLFIISSITEEFTVNERECGGSHARATLFGGSPRPLVCSIARAGDRGVTDGSPAGAEFAGT